MARPKSTRAPRARLPADPRLAALKRWRKARDKAMERARACPASSPEVIAYFVETARGHNQNVVHVLRAMSREAASGIRPREVCGLIDGEPVIRFNAVRDAREWRDAMILRADGHEYGIAPASEAQ